MDFIANLILSRSHAGREMSFVYKAPAVMRYDLLHLLRGAPRPPASHNQKQNTMTIDLSYNVHPEAMVRVPTTQSECKRAWGVQGACAGAKKYKGKQLQ